MDKRIISRCTINTAVSENEGHECPPTSVSDQDPHMWLSSYICGAAWHGYGPPAPVAFWFVASATCQTLTSPQLKKKTGRSFELFVSPKSSDARLLMRTLVSANSPILTSMQRFNWMRFATAARKYMHRSASRAAAYPLLCRAANLKIMSYFHSHQ